MPRGEGDSPAANALREAGYVKLRPLWVPRDVRDQVETMAEKYKPHVDHIKNSTRDEWQ